MVADGFLSRWHNEDDSNDLVQMMYGSTHVPPVEIVQTILDNSGRLILLHQNMLNQQWVTDNLDLQIHILMVSPIPSLPIVSIDELCIGVSVVDWSHTL